MNAEPLKDKKQYYSTDVEEEGKDHYMFYVDDVASAVAFYKKYYSNYKLFKKDFPKMFKLFLDTGDAWGPWFIDYCFADVVKK